MAQRVRQFVAVASAFGFAAVWFASPVSASSSGTATLNACLAATAHESSVHAASYGAGTASATSKTVETLSLSGDIGTTEGIQTVTLGESGKKGTETAELIDKVAYFRGDAYALQNFVGFSAANAKKYANEWFSVPKSNSAYSSLSGGLTVSSLVTELKATSPKLLSTSTVDGYKVNRLQSTVTESSVTGTIVLSCRANGTPLPVQQTATAKTSRSTLTFSKWGETIKLSKPAHTIPFSASDV